LGRAELAEEDVGMGRVAALALDAEEPAAAELAAARGAELDVAEEEKGVVADFMGGASSFSLRAPVL
jgi:hypothetical protein